MSKHLQKGKEKTWNETLLIQVKEAVVHDDDEMLVLIYLRRQLSKLQLFEYFD